jgi:hypothetical protein
METVTQFVENPTLIGGMVVVIVTLTGFLVGGAKYVTGKLEKVIAENTKSNFESAETNRLLARSVEDLKDAIEENTKSLFEFRKEQAVFNATIKHI